MSQPSQNKQDPGSPVHYAWVELESGGGRWTPGEKVRIFSGLVGEEIGPREFTVLVKLVDQIDGAAFLRREWVQLKGEDWARMLGGVAVRTARRVKASLLEKELVIERSLELIPDPEKDIVHGNVSAYRPQTPREREKRRLVRAGSLHLPKAVDGTASSGEVSEEPSEQDDSTEAESTEAESTEAEESSGTEDEDGRFSPEEFPPWLSEDWTPPTSGRSEGFHSPD